MTSYEPPPMVHPASGGAWGPPPPRRRSRASWLAAVAVALLLVVTSAIAGAGLQMASQNGQGSASSASRFAPSSPFDGSSGSSNAPDASSASSSDVQTIAARVDPAIVNIATTLESGDQAAGTGMVITSSGRVLTNNHVIAGATKIRVEIGVTGETHSASVIGYDVGDDVALLQLSDASDMKTIEVASSEPQANDAVVAIGNAQGRFGTPTAVSGTVTDVGRTITAGDSNASSETLHDMIEIQAPIEPGDSGGPLVDQSGRVVGMDTAADVGSSRFGFGAGNTGFAIPIAKAMGIVHQIESGDSSGGVHIGSGRALLGVVLSTGSGSGSRDVNGAVVGDVQSGGPADDAGLGSGDTVVNFDGANVGSASELRDALAAHQPGDKVKVGWVDSSGSQHRATVELGSGPPA